ncbi:Probable phospholipase A2 1 [Ancistrocladus abbreviatus]
MLRPTGLTVSSSIVFFIVAIFSLFLICEPSSSTNDSSQIRCSRSCVALNCNNVGIRYGKYCGVGHSGCPGEKPCDDLDACCKVHDECVGKHGMANVKCHDKFKKCIKKVQKSGKPGFSWECPYDIAVPTMVQGMDMAILMSQWANQKYEL